MASKEERLNRLLEDRTQRLQQEIKKRKRFQVLLKKALRHNFSLTCSSLPTAPLLIIGRTVYVVSCVHCGSVAKVYPSRPYKVFVQCMRLDGWRSLDGGLSFFCAQPACRQAYVQKLNDVPEELPPL